MPAVPGGAQISRSTNGSLGTRSEQPTSCTCRRGLDQLPEPNRRAAECTSKPQVWAHPAFIETMCHRLAATPLAWVCTSCPGLASCGWSGPHQRCDPRLLPHVTHGPGPPDDHALDLAHAVENVKLAGARAVSAGGRDMAGTGSVPTQHHDVTCPRREQGRRRSR